MRKKLDKTDTLLTILGILLSLEIITYIVLEIADVFVSNRLIAIIFASVTPLLIVSYFSFLVLKVNDRTIKKQLVTENKYNLGEENNFFNYYAFEKRVKQLRASKHRHSKAFVVAFTPSKSNASSSSRNEILIQFNRLIAQHLTVMYSESKKFDKDDCVYCYYHNLFLMYIFLEDRKVRAIVGDLEDQLYKIAQENELKIFVQPFFGISEVIDPKEEIFISVDNATSARNLSEKHFETITYYTEAFKTNATVNEIEEISQALKNDEFVVYYQPKFNLASKKFVSSEALVRWNSVKYGLLSPAKFISKAENGGLIHDIDMYVFKKVCEDLNETKRRGRKLLPVSVNFSLYEFYSPSFVNDVMDILNDNKVSPSLIEIEITETTSQANSFLSISIIKKLKELGFRILMDDFGIGFSNISNLKNLPVDTDKIDKTLVDNIATDAKSCEIVRFLISLCKVNGLEVIAEGVDSQEQVDILRKAKCDTIQGYYYSRPLSKVEYDKFIMSNPYERKEKAVG